MSDEVPIENARTIDNSVLDYCSTDKIDLGTAKPYIVYLNEDDVKKAELKRWRKLITNILLIVIVLDSMFLCFCIFKLCYGLSRADPPGK